ncbi:hypothetical protein ACP70R_003853 [Stipagrostis hirtigluma subsp. patula]
MPPQVEINAAGHDRVEIAADAGQDRVEIAAAGQDQDKIAAGQDQDKIVAGQHRHATGTPVLVIGRRTAGRAAKVALPRATSITSGKCSLVADEMNDEQYVRRHYTWGIHDTTFGYMILVLLLFFILTPTLPLPQVSADDPVAVVWRASMFICAQLFLLALCTRTSSSCSVLTMLSRASYAPLVAFAAASVIGPFTGMAIVHLGTAWAAGMFGYSLAQHRQCVGTERAAHVAVTLTPIRLSKKKMRKQRITLEDAFITIGFLTACLAARVLWIVFLPADNDVYYALCEISFFVFLALFFWAALVAKLLLHEALISVESMIHLYAYSLASHVIGLMCLFVSEVLWSYFFGLQMMAISAFLGYLLAIHTHYKQLLISRMGKKKNALTVRRVMLDITGCGPHGGGEEALFGC